MAAFLCAVVLSWLPAGLAFARQAEAVAMPSPVALQPRQQWVFEQDGVTFSNRLQGARLNGVERLGARHYRLTVSPEVVPVNPSPWYGFAVNSATAQRLELDFHYTESKARYLPWLSRDGGRSWHNPEVDALATTPEGEVRLAVDTDPTRLLIWAQRPVTLADFDCWEKALGQRLGVEEHIIGASVQGQPLRMLAFGNPAAKRVVLVLGRQHPPETTGSRALMAFIDAIASDQPDAIAFRASTRILVVPVMNPDGLVEGHWRTNANGVDINRDWRDFRQPETRAVRDMLRREVHDSQRSLAFALDFHSTWNDIFYTVTDDPARAPGGVLRRWMDAMQARFPGRIKEAPGNTDNGVFKSWAFAEYGAPAVTYEVGDGTTDAELQVLAAFAADTLVQLLPAPPRVDREAP